MVKNRKIIPEVRMDRVVSQFGKSCQPELVEGDYQAGFDRLNLTARFKEECISQTETLPGFDQVIIK